MHCTVAPSVEISAAPIAIASNLLASVDGIVSYLFLVDTCRTRSGLGLTVCLLLLVDLPAASMLLGLIGYAHTVRVLLLPMSSASEGTKQASRILHLSF